MKKRIRINGKLYEAVEPRRNRRSHSMNESLGKPVDRSASNKYDLMGIELPDGSPDLYFVSSAWGTQVLVYIYGVDDESGQLVLTVTDDHGENEWGMNFEADEQNSAMKKFDRICELVDEKELPVSSIAKKFGLENIPLY